MKVGLNLYSIRNLIQTEEDFLQTALKLKEMGYSYMQYSGAPFDAEKIKRVSEASGMPVVLTHVPYDRIVNDTEKLIEEHLSFGCKNIGLGMMPMDLLIDEALCKEAVYKLNEAGKIMAEKGVKFFYHHHHYEFIKHNNQTVFDYIVETAPYINFTLDTYWLQYAGKDILATLDRLKGRYSCVHLKDYEIYINTNKNNSIEPTFAPVGDGNIDFKTIVKKMKEYNVEYYLVEQDNAAIRPDTLNQVERSIKYIVKEL